MGAAEFVAAMEAWIARSRDAKGTVAVRGAEAVGVHGRALAPRRTGRLASSIVVTRVGDRALVGPTVVYGRIRELGGEILPRNHAHLKFIYHGKLIFAKRVMQGGTHYMQRALAMSGPDIYREAYLTWAEARPRA
jgi:phage gpG-like protein